MDRRSAVFLSVVFAAASAAAFEPHRPLTGLLNAADFVGVVEIRTTWPSPAAKLGEDERVGMYLQRADAYVVETLKGEFVSGRITINFDTRSGYDVIFRKDVRYIVFLSAQEDGTYSPVTMTKYEVLNDTVDNWEGRAKVSLGQVRRDVTASIVRAAFDSEGRARP